MAGPNQMDTFNEPLLRDLVHVSEYLNISCQITDVKHELRRFINYAGTNYNLIRSLAPDLTHMINKY